MRTTLVHKPLQGNLDFLSDLIVKLESGHPKSVIMEESLILM